MYLFSPPFALSMSALSALEYSLGESTGIKIAGNLAANSSKTTDLPKTIILVSFGGESLKLRVLGTRSSLAASAVTTASMCNPSCKHVAFKPLATGNHSSRV